MAKWRVKLTKKKKDKSNDPEPVHEDDLFDTKDEADAEHAKKKVKAKKGETTSQHLCSHADGELASTWYNCRNDPRAQYEEFTKETDLEGRPA